MKKYRHIFILAAIVVSAFFLRWYLMPSHLFFGPEQGRDFLVIRDIVVNHKLTLIGSKTDIAGVFHGPIYYYIAAIPFALSRGNPVVVMAFLIALQSLSVLLVYQLVFELTKKRRAGYIAAVIFAVSYLFVVYSRWLSNPPLSIPLSLIFMLCLFRFIRGKEKYLVAAAFIYGLLGQAEFINFMLFGAIGALAILVHWKKLLKTKPAIVVTSIFIGIITSFATYILFDIRHDSIVLNGFLDLMQGKSSYQVTLLVSTLGAFRVLMEQAAQIVGLSGWISGLVVTLVVAIVLIKRFVKNPTLLVLALWVLAPPVIFALLRHGMLDQLYAGVIAGYIALLSLTIDRLWGKSRVLGIAVLIIFVGLNLIAANRNLPDNYHVFFQPQQPAIRYTDQLAVIDWVYMRAASKPFSFQAYTIPYFLQDAWTYLLGYYGKNTYGYIPDNQGRKLQYVAIQKDNLDPNFQKKWYVSATSSWGTLTNRTHIGDFTVEEWTL